MKRTLDILISSLLIIIFSPILIILMILVSTTSKGGPFFLGVRIGKKGKPFQIIKFRSMKADSEGKGTWNVSGKDPRVTKFGYFLRLTKLDELPQLFNIFAGHMSFVGPRPELPVYVNLYSNVEKPILDNRPGLTDWASIVNSNQIIGFTNANNPDEYYLKEIRPLKLKLQLYYRYHNNLFTDIHCLLWTFWKVVSHTKKNPKMIQAIIDSHNKENAEKHLFNSLSEKIRIPNTDLMVSRICFGGCPMGGYGWGETHHNDFVYAIRYALDAGINFFDTADAYGLGESERVLGEAIKGRRQEVIIATKFGVRRSETGETYYDNSPKWMRMALEDSLERLQTTYVDLYYIHYLDHKTPLKEVVNELEALVKEGKIRYYGISNITKDDILNIKESGARFVSVQDEYSLATRKNEENLLAISSALGITPMTWGSLGQGILSGKISKETKFGSDDRRSKPIYSNFHSPKLEHNLQIVEELKRIANEHKKSITSVAIRFTLDYVRDSVTLVGIKNVKQLKENIEAFGWSLTEEEITRLDNISRWNN